MGEPRRMYEVEGTDVDCIPARIRQTGLCGNPPSDLFLLLEIPGGSFRVAIERKSAIQFYKALRMCVEKVPDFFQE